uniref:Sodium/solute symporter n=1 Tax=Strigamia maritima TaxID=126957 RepID=T1JG66_STRMM
TFYFSRALFINIPALIFVDVLIIYIGLVLYATFAGCDPFLNNKISFGDELLTYFVLKIFNNMPGMAGLFVAGIFSGALSTISSCLNSMAVVTIEDFLVLLPRFKKVTDKTKTCMARWIGIFWAYNNGLVFGINSGLFVLGLFCPWANSTGAACGFAASVFSGLLVAIGAQFLGVVFEPAPMSTENCNNHNLTFITNGNTSHHVFDVANESSYPMLYARDLEHNGGFYELFKISPMAVQLFSFLVALVVGMICSRLFECKEVELSDIKLFSPVIRNWVKNSWLKKESDNIKYVNQKNAVLFDNKKY